MKKINLKRFSKIGNTYSVALGNGTLHEFTSQKQTQRFLQDTSFFLTQKIYELRDAYAYMWNEHHELWGYFRHDKKTMNVGFYERDRNITRLLSEIQSSFNLIIDRSHYEGGNHSTFSHLSSILRSLREVIQALTPIIHSRSNTIKKYQYNNLLIALARIEGEISNYGYITTTNYINTSKIQLIKRQTTILKTI